MVEVLAPKDVEHLRQAMFFLFSMFFAPLEIQGMAYGLLGVNGKQREFSPVELEIFCSLGSQAAVAIENANLYQKLRRTFLHTAEALAEAIDSRGKGKNAGPFLIGKGGVTWIQICLEFFALCKPAEARKS